MPRRIKVSNGSLNREFLSLQIDSPQPADQQKSDEGRGIPPSDTSSEISDRTFTIQNRDSPENRAHSSLSLTSERHVSFADQPVQLEEEKIEFPKLERMDVRVPIDVWVSCGEPFIPFQGKLRIHLSRCVIDYFTSAF